MTARDGSTAACLCASCKILRCSGSARPPTAPIRCSPKLNATLFTAKSVGEGGSGDLRFALNKESAANTVSQLYQSNYSARAETGLTGDDNFHVKVSPDGAAWKEVDRRRPRDRRSRLSERRADEDPPFRVERLLYADARTAFCRSDALWRRRRRRLRGANGLWRRRFRRSWRRRRRAGARTIHRSADRRLESRHDRRRRFRRRRADDELARTETLVLLAASPRSERCSTPAPGAAARADGSAAPRAAAAAGSQASSGLSGSGGNWRRWLLWRAARAARARSAPPGRTFSAAAAAADAMPPARRRPLEAHAFTTAPPAAEPAAGSPQPTPSRTAGRAAPFMSPDYPSSARRE